MALAIAIIAAIGVLDLVFNNSKRKSDEAKTFIKNYYDEKDF